eukprot:GHVU01170731.1.p1 GENE.GHVU01170731.1~~GHVU01170731.1.p1  ORF type:complete len:184 (+),score=7.70 GHVU01170731.1:26-553(+)
MKTALRAAIIVAALHMQIRLGNAEEGAAVGARKAFWENLAKGAASKVTKTGHAAKSGRQVTPPEHGTSQPEKNMNRSQVQSQRLRRSATSSDHGTSKHTPATPSGPPRQHTARDSSWRPTFYNHIRGRDHGTSKQTQATPSDTNVVKSSVPPDWQNAAMVRYTFAFVLVFHLPSR